MSKPKQPKRISTPVMESSRDNPEANTLRRHSESIDPNLSRHSRSSLPQNQYNMPQLRESLEHDTPSANPQATGPANQEDEAEFYQEDQREELKQEDEADSKQEDPQEFEQEDQEEQVKHEDQEEQSKQGSEECSKEDNQTSPPPSPKHEAEEEPIQKKGVDKKKKKGTARTVTDKTEVGKEKLYCHCRRGSDVGDLIRCRDGMCEIQWFHIECVGLKSAKGNGEWYCPGCSGVEE